MSSFQRYSVHLATLGDDRYSRVVFRYQLLFRKLDLWRSCMGNENSEALLLSIMEGYYGFLV
jgi:hypothetical protein